MTSQRHLEFLGLVTSRGSAPRHGSARGARVVVAAAVAGRAGVVGAAPGGVTGATPTPRPPTPEQAAERAGGMEAQLLNSKIQCLTSSELVYTIKCLMIVKKK